MSNPGYRFLLFLSSIFINFYGGHSFAPPPQCPEYDCGNGVRIKYPFCSTDNATESEYCGYPQFVLYCYSKEPVLSIDDEEYLVKRIDYENSAIMLVDKDVARKECPRARHNTSLGNYPLDYTDLNLNISFYFNCSSNPFTSYVTAAIRCLEYGNLQSYVTVVEEDTEEVVWNGKCEASVVATVMKAPEIAGNGLIAEFGAAMNRGFELDWITARECGESERINGFCGYNRTAVEHICYFPDGSISNRCKGYTVQFPSLPFSLEAFILLISIVLLHFILHL